MSENRNLAKKVAGEKAASFVQPGMTIGLGTGSTAYWAIKRLGERVAEGLEIKAVATSVASEQLAQKWNIPIVSFAEVDYLDIDIDGADEVDPNFQLIKGGGGALLREKIIAAKSKKMVVVAGEGKTVTTLGKFALPVEVIPFGIEWTVKHLQDICKSLNLREKDGKTFVTDNGNYILDCQFFPINHPRQLEKEINNIPGVVENGLFIDLCQTIVVGQDNGDITVYGLQDF